MPAAAPTDASMDSGVSVQAPAPTVTKSSPPPQETASVAVGTSTTGQSEPWLDVSLNVGYRFLLYGLCGLAVEVAFTALWQVVEQGNRKLHGITSIYAFIIYAFSSLVVERMYLRLHHLPWYVRGFIYLVWTYAWEFSSGLFLRQFNACPWDYEPYFKGHIMGLITMEYAPLWYVGSMFEERYIIRNALQLCWSPSEEEKKRK